MTATEINVHPGYVDSAYLDETDALLCNLKHRTYELMQVGSGDTVLDLGCGPGLDTVRLAGLTGSSGCVIGIDSDPEMISLAEKRARVQGVVGTATHLLADAAALPLPDASVNSARSERLFQHLEDPAAVLRELQRILRPGARLVLMDADHGTWSTATAERETERQLARFFADTQMRNGYAGRDLGHHLEQAGFVEIETRIEPGILSDYAQWRRLFCIDETEQLALEAGVISELNMRRLHTDLRQRDERGIFYSSEALVIASARRPLH